jgi:hypothetical protein
MKKVYLDVMCWQTTPKKFKIRVTWWIFLESIASAKEEERTASADCKLGGLKHKIFRWQRRIVKQ